MNQRNSDKRLRWTILCNFCDIARSVMLTINPSNRTLSDKELSAAVNRFIKVLRKKYEPEFNSRMDYVSVLELNDDLQGFHCHIPIAFKDTVGQVKFKPNELQRLCDFGEVNVRRITSALGLAGYLTPHRVRRFNEVDAKLLRKSQDLVAKELEMYTGPTIEDRVLYMHEKAVRNEQIKAGVRRYNPSQNLEKPKEWEDLHYRNKNWLALRGYVTKEQSASRLPDKAIKAMNLAEDDSYVRYATHIKEKKARSP